MRRILALRALGAVLFTDCGGGTNSPVIPTNSGQMPPVAVLRLFDSVGTDISAHVVLVSGEARHVEVRLFAADGTTRVTGGVALAFSFDPPSLAQAASTDTVHWIITPTAPVNTEGNIFIALTPLPNSSSTPRTFGPFQTRVHPP